MSLHPDTGVPTPDLELCWEWLTNGMETMSEDLYDPGARKFYIAHCMLFACTNATGLFMRRMAQDVKEKAMIAAMKDGTKH